MRFWFGACATMMVHFTFIIFVFCLTVGLNPLAVQHGSLALLVVAAPWAFGHQPEAIAVGKGGWSAQRKDCERISKQRRPEPGRKKWPEAWGTHRQKKECECFVLGSA